MRQSKWIGIPVEEADVDRLHALAMDGDDEAKDRIMTWVYNEARSYYGSKARAYKDISYYEAQELTSQFVLHFHTCWRNVRNLTRYTRRGLRRNYVRYLADRPAGTIPLHELDCERLSVASEEPQTEAWMRWDDKAFKLYTAICQEYQNSSETTIRLVKARLNDPDATYSSICAGTNINEGAARMRVHRFFLRVRKRVERRQTTLDETQGTLV